MKAKYFLLERLAFRLLVLTAYVSHDFGQTPLPIVMKFGLNVLVTKAKRCMSKDILFLSRFKMAAYLWLFFAIPVKHLDQFMILFKFRFFVHRQNPYNFLEHFNLIGAVDEIQCLVVSSLEIRK